MNKKRIFLLSIFTVSFAIISVLSIVKIHQRLSLKLTKQNSKINFEKTNSSKDKESVSNSNKLKIYDEKSPIKFLKCNWISSKTASELTALEYKKIIISSNNLAAFFELKIDPSTNNYGIKNSDLILKIKDDEDLAKKGQLVLKIYANLRVSNENIKKVLLATKKFGNFERDLDLNARADRIDILDLIVKINKFSKLPPRSQRLKLSVEQFLKDKDPNSLFELEILHSVFSLFETNWKTRIVESTNSHNFYPNGQAEFELYLKLPGASDEDSNYIKHSTFLIDGFAKKQINSLISDNDESKKTENSESELSDNWNENIQQEFMKQIAGSRIKYSVEWRDKELSKKFLTIKSYLKNFVLDNAFKLVIFYYGQKKEIKLSTLVVKESINYAKGCADVLVFIKDDEKKDSNDNLFLETYTISGFAHDANENEVQDEMETTSGYIIENQDSKIPNKSRISLEQFQKKYRISNYFLFQLVRKPFSDEQSRVYLAYLDKQSNYALGKATIGLYIKTLIDGLTKYSKPVLIATKNIDGFAPGVQKEQQLKKLIIKKENFDIQEFIDDLLVKALYLYSDEELKTIIKNNLEDIILNLTNESDDSSFTYQSKIKILEKNFLNNKVIFEIEISNLEANLAYINSKFQISLSGFPEVFKFSSSGKKSLFQLDCSDSIIKTMCSSNFYGKDLRAFNFIRQAVYKHMIENLGISREEIKTYDLMLFRNMIFSSYKITLDSIIVEIRFRKILLDKVFLENFDSEKGNNSFLLEIKGFKKVQTKLYLETANWLSFSNNWEELKKSEIKLIEFLRANFDLIFPYFLKLNSQEEPKIVGAKIGADPKITEQLSLKKSNLENKELEFIFANFDQDMQYFNKDNELVTLPAGVYLNTLVVKTSPNFHESKLHWLLLASLAICISIISLIAAPAIWVENLKSRKNSNSSQKLENKLANNNLDLQIKTTKKDLKQKNNYEDYFN